MKADLRNEENHNNGTHRQLTHSWNVLRGAERPDTWIRATARRRLTVSLILVAGDLYSNLNSSWTRSRPTSATDAEYLEFRGHPAAMESWY